MTEGYYNLTEWKRRVERYHYVDLVTGSIDKDINDFHVVQGKRLYNANDMWMTLFDFESWGNLAKAWLKYGWFCTKWISQVSFRKYERKLKFCQKDGKEK
jgi:hypothetical protein